MLLVRTSLQPSAIHGLGCFTEEPIRQGQIVWRLDPGMDLMLPDFELRRLPAVAQSFYAMYAYAIRINGQVIWVLCGDHSRHMNHSDHPNLAEGGEQNELNIALRDIEPGEELTCNYRDFDLDVEAKLA